MNEADAEVLYRETWKNAMNQKDTLEYYEQNAVKFAETTRDVDFGQTQMRFLNKLEAGSRVLDFGCGAGRDSRFFLHQGFVVEAVDGSEELCRLASEYTGIPVRRMLFQELCDKERYDGIWACASILHLDKKELKEVLYRMSGALKARGVIYSSFKYGSFEGMRNGRYFTDFTEESFMEFLGDLDSLYVEEMWLTGDVRPGRAEERWLNLILRKQEV